MLTPLDWMEMSERHAVIADAALRRGQIASAYDFYRLATRLALKGCTALDDAAVVARDRFSLQLDLLSVLMVATGEAVVLMTVWFESLPMWTRMDRATADLVLLRDRPVDTLPEWGLM